jgi:hypothetical protein
LKEKILEIDYNSSRLYEEQKKNESIFEKDCMLHIKIVDGEDQAFFREIK